MVRRARVGVLGLGSLLVWASAIACAPPPPPTAAPTPPDPVERGRYIVNTGGCHDCHTPWKMGPNGPEPDMALALSGHPADAKLPPPPAAAGPWIWGGSATNTAFWGPWGISYAANLTSDQNTGLAVWTEQMFLTAIREGKHMGTSRPILPPMPWHVFKNFTDDDLKAIFAYLRTVPPVANSVPDPVITDPIMK
jgi:hypothetical protein